MASILPIGVENAVCQQAERQLLLGRRLVDASPPVDFFRVIESTSSLQESTSASMIWCWCCHKTSAFELLASRGPRMGLKCRPL